MYPECFFLISTFYGFPIFGYHFFGSFVWFYHSLTTLHLKLLELFQSWISAVNTISLSDDCKLFDIWLSYMQNYRVIGPCRLASINSKICSSENLGLERCSENFRKCKALKQLCSSMITLIQNWSALNVSKTSTREIKFFIIWGTISGRKKTMRIVKQSQNDSIWFVIIPWLC